MVFELSQARRQAFLKELSTAQRTELTQFMRANREALGLGRPAGNPSAEAPAYGGWGTEDALVDRLRCLVSTWKPKKTAADVLALRTAADEKRDEVVAEAAEKKRLREAAVHQRLEGRFRRSFMRRRDLTTDQVMHGWQADCS